TMAAKAKDGRTRTAVARDGCEDQGASRQSVYYCPLPATASGTSAPALLKSLPTFAVCVQSRRDASRSPSVLLSTVLGRVLRDGAFPAHVSRRDGSPALGQLRHHHRLRRCLRGSSQLWHGRHRSPVGGA